MMAGEELYSIARLYFLAWFVTIGSADYVHRHEYSIQMKNHEHPWFGNNTIRFCAFNQYLDEHEGRCMIIPGGGTAISIDDDTTCEVEALRPHPTLPSSYYACRKTKTILAECRSGQRFENRLKRCAIDVTSSSEDEFSDVEDSPEAYNHIHLPACQRPGRFPVPQGNCTIFYACTSNGFRLFRTIYRCPPLTGFDPFTKMCSPEFACDKDSESDVELAKIKPESKSTTVDPREAATTTTTRTFTTMAPSTIDLQETSPLVTSTPFSVSDKSIISNSPGLDNSDSDTTTKSIKTSTTSGFNEVETTSATLPLDLITEGDVLTTTDKIVGANQLLMRSTTQDYENVETTPTYEAIFTPEDPRDAALTTTIQTFTTAAPPTNDWQETSPLDTSTPFSVSEESTISNFRLSDNSDSETMKTSIASKFNEVETTSVTPPLNLITENEFLTTTDQIVGANQLLKMSTTQVYENEETTPTYEATFIPREVMTTENPSIAVSSSIEEISTLNSVRSVQESTTISPDIITFTDKNYESNVTPITAETTLSNNGGEDEETTIEYFTTIEPKSEEFTLTYLSENTSEADRITTTERWLFDFNPTKVSTAKEASDSPNLAGTLFTTSSTLLTTSGEILLQDPSTTTVEAETTSVLEENAADSVTPTTLGEKWLFDATRAEESSTMLLTTTVIPATSASSFIVDEKTPEVIILTTTSAAEPEVASVSGEILQNNLLTTTSTTTVESETTSVLEENAADSVTPTTLGEKWLFDATRAEESSTMLLTTTENPATSASSFVVDEKSPEVIILTTTSAAEPEFASVTGEILPNNLLTTTDDWETTTSNILESAIENVVTSPTVVNDYTNEGEFLKGESSTENSSFDENVDDDKIDTVDTTTIISKTSDSESTPIVQESPKNLVTLITTSLRNSEVTTENSWTSNSDVGSGDSFDTTSDPSASFLQSSKPIEYNEAADNYDVTTLVPIGRSDDETTNSREWELNTKGFYDKTTILSVDELITGRFYDRTTIVPEDKLNTEGFNDQTTILPENELNNRGFNDDTTIMPKDELIAGRFYDQTTLLPEDELNTRRFYDQTTILPKNGLNTEGFNDETTILPEDEVNTGGLYDQTTISSEDEINTKRFNDHTTILPEKELNTGRFYDQTTILPENGLNTEGFNDETTILPEDEENTGGLYDQTTISREDEINAKRFNYHTTILPENEVNTGGLYDQTTISSADEINTKRFNDHTTILPENELNTGRFYDQTTILPKGEVNTKEFNDQTTILPEDEVNTGGLYDQATISSEDEINTTRFSDHTTILPENEVNTGGLSDQTTVSNEDEINTKRFYDHTTILPEDELNTGEFNDQTTILPESERKTSGINDEITILPENQPTTSGSDDGPSEIPKDNSSTISTDSVTEIPSTSSYTSTRPAELTISTTAATELSSEVTDDFSTNTESSYSSISPTMDFETDTTEDTYSTSESPDETENYSDMTSNIQSTTDRSLLFSTSEEPAFSDDYTTSLPYTLRPLLKALKNSFDTGTPSDLTTESTLYDASNSASNSRTTVDYFETSSSTIASV